MKRASLRRITRIIMLHRSTMYVHATYSYQTSSVVCQSITLVNPAKTAEVIDMSFGLRTRVGPRNYVLHSGQDPPSEGAILRGKRANYCKI